MSDLSPSPDISADDWAATPATVRVVVADLLERVARLEERANKTSRTSSKPPSSDPPSAPPRPAPPVGAGQRGATGATGATGARACAAACRPGGSGRGREARRLRLLWRVLDGRRPRSGVPPGGRTPARGGRGHGLPAAHAPLWGVRRAHGGVAGGQAVGELRAPRAGDRGLCDGAARGEPTRRAGDAGGAVPPGTERGQHRGARAAVAGPVAQAHRFVQAQPTANADETSWKEGTRRRWLWVAVTALVSVFLLRPTRGSQGAKDLRGPPYAGVVGSDRWSGYTWIDPTQRQLCGAHLRRDVAACVERGGEPARVGQALLDAAGEMFGLWYRVRDGTLSRGAFEREMRPVQARVGTLLREGARLEHAWSTPGARQDAPRLREHPQAGGRLVDVRRDGRRRAHQQRRRTGLAPRRVVAAPQLWHAERRGEPVRSNVLLAAGSGARISAYRQNSRRRSVNLMLTTLSSYCASPTCTRKSAA